MVDDDEYEILGHPTPFNSLCLSCQWDPVTLVAFYFTANNAFHFHKLHFYLHNIQCLDFAHCFVKELKNGIFCFFLLSDPFNELPLDFDLHLLSETTF